MELAEVKKHFENAEFVETVSFNEKRKVDLDSIWVDCDLDFWSIEKETGYIFCLGSKKRGFAKILTTKEPSFSITKDQLRQLTDPKVKEWFPEVFKVNLEAGECFHKGLSIAHNPNKKEYFKSLETLKGNQLRYIYLIDKTCKITVPILPFSKIDEMGAGMYKGEKITMEQRKELSL